MNVVVVGQVRRPDLFAGVLDSIERSDESPTTVFSTWVGELDGYPGLRATLQDRGVEVVESDPLPLDSAGNVGRQSLLLDAGLNGFAPDDVVVKLRPDVLIRPEHVRGLADLVTDGAAIAGQPWAARLQRPIVVPWWSPMFPFQFADELFAGTAADLRLTDVVDPRVATVCAHATRFSAPFRELPSWRRFVETVLGPWVRVECARGRNHAYAVASGLPSRRRLPVPHPHPSPRPYFRTANVLPAAQVALADSHFLVGRAFRVYNPTPLEDMFIERLGPWVLDPNVRPTGTADDPLDPAFQQTRYTESPELPDEIAASGRYPVYRERLQRLRADPSVLWADLDGKELPHLVAGARHYWVDAARVASLRVTGSAARRLRGGCTAAVHG